MKAVMPTVLPEVVALRKRTGADRWDEMWEGVLHMPPAPNPDHQDFEWSLEAYLRTRWAPERKAKVYHNVNVAPPGGWPDDYRIPDLVILLPASGAVRKDTYFEGPPDVVVEIRSPGDESLEKLPFYASLGVPEVWIIDRDTKDPTIHTLVDGRYAPDAADETSGGEPHWIQSAVTGLDLRRADPPPGDGDASEESSGKLSEGAGRLSIRLAGDESTREDLPSD